MALVAVGRGALAAGAGQALAGGTEDHSQAQGARQHRLGMLASLGRKIERQLHVALQNLEEFKIQINNGCSHLR